MFVEEKSTTVFFSSDTLIYGISRDGSKNFNIRTCEHMILGQLRMGALQTKNAPLWFVQPNFSKQSSKLRFFHTPQDIPWVWKNHGLVLGCVRMPA